ncbi:hypothetical protein ACFYRC_36795 [Streptomyces sp. NPDC005279]|uniref:hypothetical protein n=1 Tax=Streptomyces sp. NPDC005279 TaxID=3364712 RepID=UPI00367E4732
MEPIAASAVVALIASYASHLAGVAGGVLDSLAADRLRGLWDTVTERFRSEPQAEGALRRLEEQPHNANRRGAVEDHLHELLDADPEFAQRLAALVREVESRADGASYTLRVEHSGPVAAGGARIDIRGGRTAAGRDVTVRGPQAAAPDSTPEGD